MIGKKWFDGSVKFRGASRCTKDDHDNCVNIGSADGRVAIHDTKQPGSVIDVSQKTFALFLTGIA